LSDENVEQSLYEAPTVEIAGEEYQLRRLGLPDLRDLWSIIRDVAGELDLSIFEEEGEAEELGVELVSQVLNVGPEAYEEIVKWLIGIVDGLEEEDIENPEKVPVHAPFTVLEALSEHEDFKKFFTRGRKAMETLKKINWGSPDS